MKIVIVTSKKHFKWVFNTPLDKEVYICIYAIHAYLHILFYKRKQLRDYNTELLLPCTYTSKLKFSRYPELQPNVP